MLLRRITYICKKKLRQHKLYRRLFWVFWVLIFIMIVTLGLFWFEYTGRDEKLESKYPSLRFVNRLPKLLDVYYLPLMFKNSHLPEYHLTIEQDYLDSLKKNLPKEHCINCLPESAAEYVDAKFISQGQEYKVESKVRGDSWNHWAYPKKSWRVKFDGENTFGEYKEFDLIIPADREFVGEYLNVHRAKKLGLTVPEMKFVVLKINAENYGVYLQQERIGPELLEKNQQAPDVNIYGDKLISDRIFFDLALWKKYNQDGISTIDNYAELNLLLNLINNSTDEEFYRKIEQIVDMDNFYRWSILSPLAGNYHQDFAHNMRLYFDSTLGKFKFIPADIGISNLPAEDLIYNPLVDRIMKNPKFMHARNQILWDYVKDDTNLVDDMQVYDQAYNQIRWPTYRDSKNNYSNFYFDKKVKLRRERFEAIFGEIRSMLSGGRADVIIDLSANLESELQDTRPMARLEFLVDNFSGVSLVRAQISLQSDIKVDSQLWLYYDANQNEKLDRQDIKLNKFNIEDNKLVAADFEQVMMADRFFPKVIDYSSDDYIAGIGPLFKPLRIKMTQHNFFVVSYNNNFDQATAVFDKFKFKLSNAITGEELDYDKVSIDNTTFKDFDNILSTPEEFIEKHPEFKLQDQSLILGPGIFSFAENIIIPRLARGFVIAPGTVIELAPDVSILSYAPLWAVATQDSPITIQRLNPKKPWGVIAVIDQRDKLSQVDYLKVSGGSQAYINGIFISGQLSFYWSDVDVKNSEFNQAQGDDSLNVKYAQANIVNNQFLNNDFDAIDLDFGDFQSIIAGNIFDNNGNDAIDLSGSAILIRDNQVLSSGDKCISLGEHSDAIVFNNSLKNCQIGIAAKDLSSPAIINNTITHNQQGIAVYQKKEIFGGGQAWVYGSILQDNKEDFYSDEKSEINHVKDLKILEDELGLDLNKLGIPN